MGSRTAFTMEQNAALRSALRELRGKYTSQSALGEALGIEQQNAGRLLRDDSAGFAYMTATAVARLAGYASVDSFFRAKGVLVPAQAS